MKQHLRRLTALLMALAMVMSFAVTAAATEQSDAEVSTTTSEQEVDPAIEAENLLDVETENDGAPSDEEEQEDPGPDESGASASSSAPGEESVDEEEPEDLPEVEEEEAEEVEEADESQETDEVENDVSAQVAGGMGWATTVVEETTYFTLTYNGGTAASGLYAVPAEEKVLLDGKQYTFGAGVYEFDASGHMLMNTTLTAGKSTKKVSLLEKDQSSASLSLNLKDAADRMVDVKSASVTQSEVDGVSVFTPAGTLVNGMDGDTLYYQGVLYTGLYRESAGDTLFGVKNGKKTNGDKGFNGQMLSTGKMVKSLGFTTYLEGETLTEGAWGDGLWYYEGAPYTGYFQAKDANDPKIVYFINNGRGGLARGLMAVNSGYDYIVNYRDRSDLKKGEWFVDGVRFTGWYQNAKTKVVYLLNNGKIVPNQANGSSSYTGLMRKMTMKVGNKNVTFNAYAENNTLKDAKGNRLRLTGLYYQLGTPLTGVPSVKPTDNKYPDIYLYKNGRRQKVKDGWYKLPRAEKDFWKPYVYYYFKNNKGLTGGPYKLKAIQNGKYKDSHSYYYYFKSAGQLVTNLIKYNPSILKTGKFRIHADHTTYTGTILMRNSKTGKYDIPVKSFVVAMSLSKSSTASTGTKYGNYPLASGHSSWYHYKSPRTGSWCWYSSSVHIWGSGSMFHSSNYKDFKKSASQKTRLHKMTAHIYNQIGTAVTQHCVRAQTINIRLITDMYKKSAKFTNHGRHCTKNVRVYLSKSTKSNFMPFGQMTMTNNFDINGYIIEDKDMYGYGKDCAFDPTDHKCKGETIYIVAKKADKEKPKAATKVKMTGYSWYELYYDYAK